MIRTSRPAPAFPLRLNGRSVALLPAIADDALAPRGSSAQRSLRARLAQLRLPHAARVQLRARGGNEPLLARLDLAFDHVARRIVALGSDQASQRLLRAACPDLRRLRCATSPSTARRTRRGLAWRLRALTLPSIDRAAIEARGFIAQPEPRQLHLVGFDRARRPMLLAERAARAWLAMRSAAHADGVALEPISTFRSIAYQRGLIARKLARGDSLEAILLVNAAPGYSEHHSGRAIDIGTPGCAPLDEAFERTPAFAWLVGHAARFGFHLSYPRGNALGVIYEPWHWLHVGG
jgi:D-alanyl-D-alanine carboxypeptidase